ncbi:radical SAM/SPASM domain-containing protein [Desulfolucanica intricata]|uniref:radical SAM/SPASM domain-containing protein n=1 Tax=Desulfolucanica intricata TaxID=1285191 RepID=UPI001352084C|nr:radical SAM protein [Desulfolucanica intricata]
MLDGKTTVRELIYKIDTCIPQSLQKTCIQFIESLASNYPSESLELAKPELVSTIYFVLTSECNSRCVYCFRDLDGSSAYLDKNLIKDTILSFKKISTENPTIVYTGGEPCLFPNLMDIVNYAKEINIENTLQTNGSMINQENAQLYADTFDTIQISLDSTNEEINDWLRGKKGHYKAVSEAIPSLLKHNVKVRLAATITKKNFNDILNIKKNFPDVEFQFTPMLQIGKGKKYSWLAFSPEEFLEHIANLPHKDYFAVDSLVKFGTKSQMCGAGTSVLSISEKGDVYPCQMLHHPDFCCGNIKTSSLETIYHTSETISKFRNLKVDMLDGCKDCDIRYICAGGCRANAFWMNHDVLDKDYFCQYNKELYFYNMANMFTEVNIN